MTKSFVFGIAVSDYNFTGREKETLQIVQGSKQR